MVELLSAARTPVVIGVIFALVLLGARAVGVGRVQSDREIADMVAMTTIISTAANVGNHLHHYWLAMAPGIALGFVASAALRRVLA